MYMHFEYGGLKIDGTGSFTLLAFKQDFSSIILGGWYIIKTNLMQKEVTFIFLQDLPVDYFKNLQ